MQIRIEGPAVTPLQTGFAQNWLQTTGELISGAALLSRGREPAGSLAAADDHELAGDRRLDRADHVLPVDHLRAALDLHRQPVLRAGRGARSTR